MQIESLKVFCDLAETESFTRAAQINHVTQSAVSQQISSLERQFKSLLIERSKKKFRLTREGQVLYDYSKQIIQTYDALHSKLQEIKDIISGTIRVATIYSIGLHDLPPYIKRFLKDYPTVQTAMEFDNIETVKRAVEIDAGISIVPQGTITQEISKQTLASVQIDDADFFRPLAAIYKKSKVLSPAMRQFISILKEAGAKDTR